jgi:hypothetical protein
MVRDQSIYVELEQKKILPQLCEKIDKEEKKNCYRSIK